MTLSDNSKYRNFEITKAQDNPTSRLLVKRISNSQFSILNFQLSILNYGPCP